MKAVLIFSLVAFIADAQVCNGEIKPSESTINKDQKLGGAGKTRGEQLAVETNSELISSGERVQQTSSAGSQCNKDGSTCMTCRSVGMCKNGVLTEVQCRGLYPYCDARTGSCTSERRRCKEEEKAMVCPTEGFYPDPQSCRAFHVCEGTPMSSYKFACSSLQVYDHEEKKCSRPSFRVRCSSFSCFGKQGRYTPYPADRSVYTLCADASATGLFKCPNNQEFDETKQKCVPACTTEESMPDTDDDTCRKYYRCVKSFRNIDAVPSHCPPQQVFDSSQGKCVPRSQMFVCDHSAQPIGSPQLTTTLPSLSPINEETYFRESPLDKTHENGNNQVEETVLPAHLTTSSSIGTQTTNSVSEVLSQLSNQNTNNGHSHPPSKIVVRETMTSKPEADSTTKVSQPTEPASKTHDYPSISEKFKTTSNKPVSMIYNSHTDISSSNAANNEKTKISESKSVYTSTTEKAIQPNSGTTILTGQTYKITTPEQMDSHVTTQAPAKHQLSAQKQQASSAPVIKDAKLPSQVFQTKDTDDNILHKIDVKQTKTDSNHLFIQQLSDVSTMATTSSLSDKTSTTANSVKVDSSQFLI